MGMYTDTQLVIFDGNRRRSDSNRRITVLQTVPLSHLGTSPKITFKMLLIQPNMPLCKKNPLVLSKNGFFTIFFALWDC